MPRPAAAICRFTHSARRGMPRCWAMKFACCQVRRALAAVGYNVIRLVRVQACTVPPGAPSVSYVLSADALRGKDRSVRLLGRVRRRQSRLGLTGKKGSEGRVRREQFTWWHVARCYSPETQRSCRRMKSMPFSLCA
jgi:hypothetical protein